MLLLAKEWALNTGKLPLGCLPRNSVVKYNYWHPNMTSAVKGGHKASNQANKKSLCNSIFNFWMYCYIVEVVCLNMMVFIANFLVACILRFFWVEHSDLI